MNIGDRIRTLRIKRQMTQKKLAELIGKEASFISHIERNARNISLRVLQSIARELGISPIEIISMGANDFEKCVEKMSKLDETGLRKVNDYLDFLVLTQKRTTNDEQRMSNVEVKSESSETTVAS